MHAQTNQKQKTVPRTPHHNKSNGTLVMSRIDGSFFFSS
jgi:hypothetical protein